MSDVLIPTSLDEALALLADDPELSPLAGGTDFMVEVNHGSRRPQRVLALRAVPELHGWHRDGDHVVIGAGCTYAAMEDPAFVALAPALAQAARTVGSPQIRNAGTIGGNLATASPAGDTLPVLMAQLAEVDVASTAGTRTMVVDELIVGVKRTVLAPDELITSIRIPAADGPQEFCKIGTRNAMVISTASVAVVLDRGAQRVGCGLGSVTAAPTRATQAEDHAAGAIDWARPTATGAEVAPRFGELAAAAAAPIDDHRSTAAYRSHAVGVMARRALERCLS
ncbi:MAG: FAD binding domain-containing protein [Acidimicrobiia bacterium]|nr:FAD binding domain-containing protein [Acidimicrobiia bacterium]